MRCLLWLLLLIITTSIVQGTNWAQTNGVKKQQTTITSGNGWSARWGHAILNFKDDILFVLGGDDYDPNVDKEKGKGGFRNDVWKSSGADWEISRNILTNQPKIISRMTWKIVTSQKLPPQGATYDEWLECFTRKWLGASACSAEEDKFNTDLRRWSPRRNHAVVEFKDKIFVLGGRAVGDDFEMGGDYEVILKNDVWSSSDGEVWTLNTPGCKYLDPRYNAHVEHADCFSDNECFGDSQCVNPDTGQPVQPLTKGRCRCRMWSARERHAVAVYDDYIYVSGGVEHVPVTYCGDYPCGGGYHRVASDVWKSSDGEYWIQLASIKNKIADHKLIILGNELAIISAFGLMSLEGNLTDFYNSSTSLADLNGLEDEASGGLVYWQERFLHILHDNHVYEYLNGKWVLDEPKYTWIDGPIETLKGGLNNEEISLLKSFDINTVNELARADPEKIVKLREEHGFENVCYHRKRAEAVLMKCQIKPYHYDGYFSDINRVTIERPNSNPYLYLRGSNDHLTEATHVTYSVSIGQPPVIPADAMIDTFGYISPVSTTLSIPPEGVEFGPYGWDGCQQPYLAEDRRPQLSDVPIWQEAADNGDLQDVICHSVFPNRTHLRAESFKDKVYIFGGRYEMDTWYRDEVIPTTYIKIRPTDRSSETIFEFECDEEACLWEYTVFVAGDPSNIMKPWTLTTDAIDYIEWLDGGDYTIQVRAIDPAGNKDLVYEDGRNEYTWRYSPKIPLILILGIIFAFISIIAGIYLEIRRRRKKAVLERYALKRMRRKFKGMEKISKKRKVKETTTKKKKKKKKKKTTDGTEGEKKKKKKQK